MTTSPAARTSTRPEIDEIVRMLAGRAQDLAQDLLPAGRRDGQYWKVGSVHGEAGRSMSVRLSGARAGKWADYASDEYGDALDLVAAVLYGGDLGRALEWACSWLGFSSASAPAFVRSPAPRPRDDRQHAAETAKLRAIALKIWLAGRPSLAGTPAAAYLLGRGIDLARLGRQPRALRYHPGLYSRETDSYWPGLVAAVTDDAGMHVATHRTWLAERDGAWGKAPLIDAKKSIGPFMGGSIRLWRGASGKPLGQAPDGEAVAIGEGIETSLSVVIACPELRVLCAVSLANMANLVLPAAVTTVILCADNDSGNDKAAAALKRAAARYQGEGREVRMAMPATAGADWNDVLQDHTA